MKEAGSLMLMRFIAQHIQDNSENNGNIHFGGYLDMFFSDMCSNTDFDIKNGEKHMKCN